MPPLLRPLVHNGEVHPVAREPRLGVMCSGLTRRGAALSSWAVKSELTSPKR